MNEDNLRSEIARLEVRLEELADSIETCRKFDLAAKVALVAGGILGLALIIGAISFDPVAMLIAITAIMGGIVLLGSNKRTREQTEVDIRETQARRDESIDMLALQAAGEEPPSSVLPFRPRARLAPH